MIEKNKKNRSKKIYYSVVASGIYELVLFICGLIIPRLMIKSYGSSNYGMISSVSQFLSYISILTLGVSGPTRVALYSALSKNDFKAVSAVINESEDLYRKTTLFFVGYIIFLSLTFPYIVKCSLDRAQISALVIIIGIGAVSEYCFGVTYVNVLYADQCKYYYTILCIIVKVLNTAVSICLIQAKCSLVCVEIGSAAFNTLQPIFLRFFVKKKYPIDRKIKASSIIKEQKRDAAASSVANIVHNKTDIFLLSLFSSTALISVYSVYMIIMNGLISVMNIFTGALEAPFGNMFAKQESSTINKCLEIYELCVYSFAAIVFSCAFLLIIPFISLYTESVTDARYAAPFFAKLLIVTTIAFCLRTPYITLVQAAGKYKENKKGNYIEACLNFTVSILLVRKFNIVGVTVGTLVANIFRTLLYANYVYKELVFKRMSFFFKRIIWLVITIALIVFFARIVITDNICSSWDMWLKNGVICVTVSFLVTAIMGWAFYKNSFKDLMKALNQMIFGGAIMGEKLLQTLSRLFTFLYGLVKQTEKSIVFLSFAGKQYSCNPRAISEKMHELYPEYRIIWYLKEEDYYNAVPDYVEKISGVFAFRKAVATSFCVVNNCAFGEDYYKKRNQLFIQTWHGDRPFKKILYDAWENSERPFAIRDGLYTDYMISGSECWKQVAQSAFKYHGRFIDCGCPRNDIILKPNDENQQNIRRLFDAAEDTKILLYAPTINDKKSIISSQINIKKLLSALEKKTNCKWKCLYRAHVGMTIQCEEDDNIIDATAYPDMADLLPITDFLISDYSSCATDFSLTGKPVVMLWFESDAADRRELYFTPEEAGFIVAHSQQELFDIISNTTTDAYKEADQKVNCFFQVHETGHSSETVCKTIDEWYHLYY